MNPSLALEGTRLSICAALKHNHSGICANCANRFWEIDGFLSFDSERQALIYMVQYV